LISLGQADLPLTGKAIAVIWLPFSGDGETVDIFPGSAPFFCFFVR
jgi:hypothetical protein